MSSVLIIDDDEVTLSLMRELLQGEGYVVNATADGPQGLSICRQRRPDLVVLDLALPSMNGLEVLRRIRRLDKTIAVVILTGMATPETREVVARYGVSAFLLKPVEIESFLRAVRQALTPGDAEGLHH